MFNPSQEKWLYFKQLKQQPRDSKVYYSGGAQKAISIVFTFITFFGYSILICLHELLYACYFPFIYYYIKRSAPETIGGIYNRPRFLSETEWQTILNIYYYSDQAGDTTQVSTLDYRQSYVINLLKDRAVLFKWTIDNGEESILYRFASEKEMDNFYSNFFRLRVLFVFASAILLFHSAIPTDEAMSKMNFASTQVAIEQYLSPEQCNKKPVECLYQPDILRKAK